RHADSSRANKSDMDQKYEKNFCQEFVTKRRSSDLDWRAPDSPGSCRCRSPPRQAGRADGPLRCAAKRRRRPRRRSRTGQGAYRRTEVHASEPQTREKTVSRQLLGKKKRKTTCL